MDSEGVMALIEDLLMATVPGLCPQLKMSAAPFPRMPYSEAMEKVR